MSEPYSGMNDILFGYDEDISFNDGDLQTTTGIDYIEREIYKLLITVPSDWRAAPQVGCSPDKFIGETNTRDISKKIETYLTDGLRQTVSPGQLSIRIVPVDYSKVICLINVFIQDLDITTIPFELDFSSGFHKLNRSDPVVMANKSSNQLVVNDISNLRKPNKYWSRLRESTVG